MLSNLELRIEGNSIEMLNDFRGLNNDKRFVNMEK